jgi:apolipoprotein N-acyltransferase
VSRARVAALFALGLALEVAAFPPFALWPLAYAMLAPLAAVAASAAPRRAFAFAWAQQTLAGLLVTHWCLHALVVEYEASLAPSLAFLALVIGAYALLPAAAIWVFARLRDRVAPALLPIWFGALFVLAEWLRAEPLGNPWMLAAQPLAQTPLLIQGADLGGPYLPGLCAAALGAGIALAVLRRSARLLVAPAALLATSIAYGAIRIADAPEGGPTLAIGVVQAAVPQRERFQPGSALRNTLRHVELTRALVAGGPLDLVVWSETSVDDVLDVHPEILALLRVASSTAGAPIVTGTPRLVGGRSTNSVVEIDGSGIRTSYAKQKLVPFAESDPQQLYFLGALLGPVTDGEPYVAGSEPTVFAAPIPFATPVCFEMTDPGLVRRFRTAGAELLVNLSNDAWFGRTGYAEVHLAQAIFRAVELRTWIARGTNTGISAVVDPAGRVVAQLGVGVEGSLRARVGSAWPASPYARAGSVPFVLLLALFAIGSPLRSRRRSGARSTADRPRSGPGRRGGRSRA